MNETDVAWAAGIIDGEGCIHVQRRWPESHRNSKSLYHYLRLSVTNTDIEMLKRLQSIFQGSINQRKDGSFEWGLGGMKAVKALVAVGPYSTTKRKEIELGINFQILVNRTRCKGRTRPDIETIAQRDAYYWALREAKHHGKDNHTELE